MLRYPCASLNIKEIKKKDKGENACTTPSTVIAFVREIDLLGNCRFDCALLRNFLSHCIHYCIKDLCLQMHAHCLILSHTLGN